MPTGLMVSELVTTALNTACEIRQGNVIDLPYVRG